jgi:hypothetical protein
MISAALSFTLCWVGLYFTLNKENNIFSYLIIFIAVAFICVWTGRFINEKWINKRTFRQNINWNCILDNVVDSSVNKPAQNLIFLFMKKEKGSLKFLVQRNLSWGKSYFFLYITDNFSENISESRQEIKESISGKFQIPANIPYRIHHISDIDFSSVKLNPERIPQEFHYRFLLVSPKFPFLTNGLYKLLTTGENPYEWKSVQDLSTDTISMANNSDVIERIIQYNHRILTEYTNLIDKIPSKIIWNFDKNCHGGCTFCAYGNDNRPSLSLQEKQQIIESLSGLRISDLDIAVGDNVDITDLSRIIKKAKDTLSGARISLTATSSVIEKILAGKKNVIKDKSVSCIDISIDVYEPSNEERVLRIEKYNENNYNIARKLKGIGALVRVQCVITKHTTVRNLTKLVAKLKSIGIMDILFIRMMPVGKLNKETYPEELLDKRRYVELIKEFGNTPGVRFHCSLKGLAENGTSESLTCDMGCQKLGISMHGDLYSCPWAEHLPGEDNPFLIGNLLLVGNIDDLILNNEIYSSAIHNKTKNQPHCKIFSYVYGDDPYSKNDKIYE